MEIRVKRLEDKNEPSDGFRIYVERRWPVGTEHEEGCVDLWLKDIAPGEGGEAWFAGKPERWGEFECGYFAELDEKSMYLRKILDKAESGPVTLLYDNGPAEHNIAVAIKDYIETKRDRILRAA